MKRKKAIIIVLIVATVLLVHTYNNFIPIKLLIGKYVNTNYTSSSGFAEIPDVADTLELFKNNTYYSRFWGNGTFKISYTLGGTNINLTPKNQHNSGFSTTCSRSWFSGPKIILVEDLNHYYEKLE